MSSTDSPTRSHFWLWAVGGLAMVAGAVFFFIRETEARECRQALASASATYGAYENEKINAALALAKEINREKAERCFVNGLIAAPPD